MSGPIRIRVINPHSSLSMRRLDEEIIQRGLDKHGLLPEEIFG